MAVSTGTRLFVDRSKLQTPEKSGVPRQLTLQRIGTNRDKDNEDACPPLPSGLVMTAAAWCR